VDNVSVQFVDLRIDLGQCDRVMWGLNGDVEALPLLQALRQLVLDVLCQNLDRADGQNADAEREQRRSLAAFLCTQAAERHPQR